MRLTLRTMLAYMDEILEPEDAEAIGRKIEESEFATSLLHRIRGVMRRLRLGSPEVTDRRAGLDANTVAEYLDNTLAPDRVLDFEKVCLESDVHLAEVASCHQVLALVLGEPVDVDVASRQRMYQLPDLVSAQVKAATEGTDLPTAESAAESPMGTDLFAAEPTTPLRRAGSAVPDGRLATRAKRSWWPAVAAAGLILLCGVVVLALTGQLQPLLGSIFGLGGDEELTARAPDSAPGAKKSPAASPSALPEPAGAKPSQAVWPDAEKEAPQPPGPGGLPSGPPSAAPGPEKAVEVPAGPVAPSGLSKEPIGPGIPPPSEVGTVPSEGQPTAPTQEVPAGKGPLDAAAPPLTQPPAADLVMRTPDVSRRPGGPGVAQPGAQPAGPTGAQVPAGPAPLPPEPVGQLDAPGQVLLVFDDEAGAWQRLLGEAPLMSQTSYLCLPTYRPAVRIADQMRLVLADGTRIRFLPTDPQGVAGLAVEYGRLTMETLQKAAIRLQLKVGDRSGVVTFADSGSKLAIEVSRALGSNVDPETQPAPLRADLYAVSGKILWQEGASPEAMTINAPVGLRLSEDSIEFMAAETVPDWIVADTIKLLDKRARGTVERALEPGRPVNLRLLELADHRQREVRWLAVRSLGWIGDFELMVAALDNPDEKSVWRDYVVELRQAVVRGPEVAASVRRAMERFHGQEGARLYEMLWRYGDRPLSKEDADGLVGYLDHDTLAFRRLGFWNLQKGTGGPDLFYRPEDTALKRLPAVRKWKEWLRSRSGLRAKPPEEQEKPNAGDHASAEAIVPGMKD